MRLEEKLMFRPGLQRASTSDEADFPVEIAEKTDKNVMLQLDTYSTSDDQSAKSSVTEEEEAPESPNENKCMGQFKKYDSSSNLFSCYDKDEELVFPKTITWDWPLCNEGIARGAFMVDKFMICLPFNNGGTGETNGSTKKFERISECNFSWTVGLSNSGDLGTGFWRMELEVIRNLNMLALIVSRDISVKDSLKKLKRVRKVYKLPDYYDVRTLRTKSYDWAIILEAEPRVKYRSGRPIRILRRADTMT